MTDDLVKWLRAQEATAKAYGVVEQTAEGQAADRIEFLEAALSKISLLSEARSRHAWDDHANYYRISTDALDGKKDDE